MKENLRQRAERRPSPPTQVKNISKGICLKERVMKWSDVTVARMACAYFFFCPGLTYGILTSRLPALKAQTGANEAQIGIFLLCLGLASLAALFSSGRLIARLGSRFILRLGSLVLLIAIVLCGLAPSPFWLGAACVLAGLGSGLTDVSMNTQGIQIERLYHTPCLSFMHASYSLGGVVGSLTGALFASLNLSPFINALCVLGVYACFRPLTVPKLQADAPAKAEGPRPSSPHRIPLFVVLCGILSMCAYAAEGSVAEWGSLLLFTVKGAPEQIAALVFAAFSAATVLCRLFGDRLRARLGDFPVAFGGAALAACGMAAALFSAKPVLCLCGYMLMGAGLSPLVPTLFSRAGSYPGISAGKASAVVSIFSYSGLLFFPPMLGFLAHKFGLAKALLVVLALCILIALGTLLLRKRPIQK